ncbi:hypothetical protein EJA71_09485 [Pseudomonas sp. PB106]|nr:hypothetical protein EJA71_09485 [Pseudomonas sp. PB106]
MPNQMICRRLGLPFGWLLVLMHATRGRVTHEIKKFQLSFVYSLSRQVLKAPRKVENCGKIDS